LWQPAQAFASGADTRLKFRGKTRGAVAIGQRISGSFAEWPPAALLNGPVGGEELPAELDQIGDADLELFVVLEMPLDGDLAAEAGGPAILCQKYTTEQRE